jgi:hypothetical protein
MKGGGEGDSIITGLFTSGIGAYAAKNSNSMSELLWTLAKYSLVIIGILLAIYFVAWLFRAATTDHFVPIAPSKEGDEKVVTPAGNVIMY